MQDRDRIKINIDQISDDRKYQDLALLFDGKVFQSKFIELKKTLPKNLSPHKLYAFLVVNDNINQEIKKFLNLVRYPNTFLDAVMSGLKTGAVSDLDVENVYSNSVITHTVKDNHPYYAANDEVLISVYPNLIKGKQKKIVLELKDVLKKIQRDIVPPLPKNHPFNIPPIKTIRKQRTLYWLNIESHGYRKLQSELGWNRKTITSSIQAYKKLLKKVST